MIINFFKFTESATIPTKENPTDAGIDIYCNEDFSIYPNGSAVVGTGIGWEPEISEEDDYLVYAQIKARSGMALNKGIEVSSAGVLDQEYRGDWKLKFINLTRKKIDIKKGTKVAQAIIHYLPKTEIVEKDVSLIGETTRGTNGFGSSGY